MQIVSIRDYGFGRFMLDVVFDDGVTQTFSTSATSEKQAIEQVREIAQQWKAR